MTGNLTTLFNGSSIPWSDIPESGNDRFLQTIVDCTDRRWRVVSYFGLPEGNRTVLCCLLAKNDEAQLGVMKTVVEGDSFLSIARYCSQVQLFEREIAEQCGIRFEDHPWFKPVRFHRPFVSGRDAWGRSAADPIKVGVMDYFQVDGDEVHEVAVGPVHAGIIEPGHFRFQCHGELVFHLEISLGFQHRGIERSLIGGPSLRTIHQMETIAGDTTIGHGQAYCMVVESLGGTRTPACAEAIRGIALELERLANHTGDLGAIAGDVGYLPTASFCGRIRGDFLNMTAVLCGSRFGRGLLTPGGTLFDLSAEQRNDLLNRLEVARSDLTSAVELLWCTPSVMSRLEGTGTVSGEIAAELGLVGPPARACGIKRDVRQDNPFGIFRMAQIPVVTGFHGDVCARTVLRWQEAQKSIDFIAGQLRQLPAGSNRVEAAQPAGNMLAVALTEGWRGEICHVAITDDTGRFRRYKVTDPSFHNWQGLAMALRGGQISDFPLCNKSFNLSYCGYDL
ncbi:carbon monoxide-induced hydrogenase [Geobacter sp. OR-1]|uniref:hydrogenase large subunit n=1 Tax=Geobacter sp. OR-1 TaxID=1266765 RepID=UPI000544033F|nr:NADH-quinone oxidoreductase subunit C [Geobacter sp. OR-1]GAM08464.1 carbon monoxide-induced hydrogenase [Geobacter sp. OR-1]